MKDLKYSVGQECVFPEKGKNIYAKGNYILQCAIAYAIGIRYGKQQGIWHLKWGWANSQFP